MPQISVCYKNAGRLNFISIIDAQEREETVFYTPCTRTVAALLCWLNETAGSLAKPETSPNQHRMFGGSPLSGQMGLLQFFFSLNCCHKTVFLPLTLGVKSSLCIWGHIFKSFHWTCSTMPFLNLPGTLHAAACEHI